jgi:DNA replication and repair protein RecF
MQWGLGFGRSFVLWLMLEYLQLRDFRCFTDVRVELDAEATALVGRNGLGKTSLMEAACILMRLQSPRTANREEWIRMGQTAAVVTGRWGGRELRAAVSKTARRLAMDGVICGRAGDYLAGTGVVVWMDHADMNLLRGGAEHRRRFLDFAASQLDVDYLPALRAYERALRGRNHVLKRDAVIAWRQADAFGRVMAEQARVLTARRATLVAALLEPVARFYERVSGGAEVVAVSYERGSDTGMELEEEWLARREEEARLRMTVCGPHRDDLGLMMKGADARAYASEGQQRTLALALKLAQAEVLSAARGIAPLLLMDDVFGELDRERRRAFLSCLPGGTQKVMTTTRLDWMEDGQLAGKVLEVMDGGALRAAP